MKHVLLFLTLAIALMACDTSPERYVRTCVDEHGLVVEEYRCENHSPGLLWTYYPHYYAPGHTVIIHDGLRLPPSQGYVTHSVARSNPIYVPRSSSVATAVPASPRVSSVPVRTGPSFSLSSPRVSTAPVRTSPPARSFSSMPVRSTPVRSFSSPRVSTMRSR